MSAGASTLNGHYSLVIIAHNATPTDTGIAIEEGWTISGPGPTCTHHNISGSFPRCPPE